MQGRIQLLHTGEDYYIHRVHCHEVINIVADFETSTGNDWIYDLQ